MNVLWRTPTERRVMVLSTVLAVLLFLPGSLTPAVADSGGTFTIAGQAQLGGGIGAPPGSAGCFDGLAVGVHVDVDTGPPDNVGVDAALPGTASATFLYDNQLILTGTAEGELTVTLDSGDEVAVDFTWARLGATAVMTFSGSYGGAAVAGFAPTQGVNNARWICQPLSGADEFAIVAGVGVLTPN